jgi:hypothetical protein
MPFIPGGLFHLIKGGLGAKFRFTGFGESFPLFANQDPEPRNQWKRGLRQRMVSHPGTANL